MAIENNRGTGYERRGEIKQVDISRRPSQTARPQGRPRTQERATVPESDRPPVRGATYHRGTNTRARSARRRRRQRRRRLIGCVLFLLVLLAAVLGILYGRAKTSCQLEAGAELNPADFVRYGGKLPTVTEGLTKEQMCTPGTYTIKIKLAPFTYKAKVTVQDTVAPRGTGQEVYGMYGQIVSPESFLARVEDATDVTVSYVKQPDPKLAGEQDVQLLLTDEGGNTSKVNASLYVSNLMQTLTWEAGAAVPAARDFLEEIAGFEDTQISYVTDISGIDLSVLGTHEIQVLLDGRTFSTVLNVVDTVSPEVTVQHVEGWINKEIDPQAFVKKVVDATTMTYTYGQQPDWSKKGSGSAVLVATDAGGNRVQETVTYNLKEDTEAPQVSLSTIDIIIGEPVSYKKAVIFSDNCDKQDELTLTVDNSKVDPNTEGEYEVTYKVTDTSGNSTTKTGTVYVLAEKPIYYDEDMVNEKADEVLAEILNEGMSQLEQARAIYNWVHSKIGYISHSEKGDWVRGAYEGLVDRRGDCFVYAATARLLLTRAGIPNIDIVKSAVNPTHYWSLVDVGDGWYHFDATPRKDKTVFFMWTDEELKKYSESHKNSHIYDPSLYPEIN